jgi:hypothetical protein
MQRESYAVAKISSDDYEDGAGIKVRLVRMPNPISEGDSREHMELDLQLAALSTAT